MMKSNNRFLRINDEVKQALDQNKPILAMESTIISHGLPYPENIEIALELEDMTRRAGVTPATICLDAGKINIGMDREVLEKIATAKPVAKVTRRNLPKVLAEGQIGATTVAATMIAANLAGINVFATGGIGGVHRHGNESLDISADLQEFAKTPVIVVSAGVKAILDIPKTLEYLETMGVPVFGYQTTAFPAFYSRQSGLSIQQINDVKGIANTFFIQKELGFKNGIIVANPIPEADEIPYSQMEIYIVKAIEEAEEKQIIGPALTPFLLKRIVELTEGASLKANLALVRNNVRLGCDIAKELIYASNN